MLHYIRFEANDCTTNLARINPLEQNYTPTLITCSQVVSGLVKLYSR